MADVINRASILETENTIFIISSNTISKNKETVFISEELLNENIEYINFWKEEPISPSLIKIEGNYVSKFIPSINIVFDFEVETFHFLSNLKFKFLALDNFCKSLNIGEKLKINEFSSKNIFACHVYRKELNNLKKFVNVFSVEKFLDFLSENNKNSLNWKNLNFSINYNLISNSYNFTKDNSFVNFLNVSFLKTNFLKNYINEISNNQCLMSDRDFKFYLMLYFLKNLNENTFQNFISDFEKHIVLDEIQ